LQAEVERLKANIALDKKAENARELGLDYEPAPVQEPAPKTWELTTPATALSGKGGSGIVEVEWFKRPAPVQEPVAWQIRIGDSDDWSWSGSEVAADFYGKQSGLRYEKRPLYTAPQPVPVKTYHDGKPWPVQPKPWVGLTDEEMQVIEDNCLEGGSFWDVYRTIEAKLKEKNNG
jgi:hypothetical protein